MIWKKYLHPRSRASGPVAAIVDWSRTVVTVTVGVAATLVDGIAIIGIAAVRPDSKIIDRILRSWARLILTVAGVRVEIHNGDRIDPAQAYVVIANHRSMFDIMCLFAVLPLRIRFLAKRELFSIPLFGTILRSLRMVSIDRSAADHVAINATSGAALESGVSLVVFAEGTRVSAEDQRPFKKGGFIIAQQHNAPILPITLAGSDRILPPRGKTIRSATVALIIAEPIPSSVTVARPINQLVRETEAIVLGNEQQWPPKLQE